jgi:hypothetical protein
MSRYEKYNGSQLQIIRQLDTRKKAYESLGGQCPFKFQCI